MAMSDVTVDCIDLQDSQGTGKVPADARRDWKTLGVCQSKPVRCVPGCGSEPTERPVSDAVPAVLRAPGSVCAPEQGPGWGDAGSDSTGRGKSWPGRDIGVRCPDAGETPLSLDEVQAGVKCGEFDGWPMRQRIVPAGAWERKITGVLAAPSVWEGLL
jgi:hypothetical protein